MKKFKKYLQQALGAGVQMSYWLTLDEQNMYEHGQGNFDSWLQLAQNRKNNAESLCMLCLTVLVSSLIFSVCYMLEQ